LGRKEKYKNAKGGAQEKEGHPTWQKKCRETRDNFFVQVREVRRRRDKREKRAEVPQETTVEHTKTSKD